MSDKAPIEIRSELRPSRFQFVYALELLALDDFGSMKAPESVRIMPLPINPEDYEVDTQYGAEIDYPAGGVSADESGVVTREITVTGTTGIQSRRGKTAGTVASAGEWTFDNGPTLWRELRAFMEVYQALKADPAQRDKWVMVWHSFKEDDHWVVIPKSFTTPRTASETRMHYKYRIQMTAVMDASAFTSGFFQEGFFKDYKDTVGKATRALNDAAGYASDANGFVTGLDAALVGPLKDVLTASQNVVTETSAFVAGTKNFLNAPQRLLRRASDVVNQAALLWEQIVGDGDAFNPLDPGRSEAAWQLQTLRALEAQYESVAASTSLYAESWQEVERRQQQLANGEASLTDAEVSAAASESGFDLTSRATVGSGDRVDSARARANDFRFRRRGDYTGSHPYIVIEGDTIFGIAMKEMGDPNLWVDLIDANQLRSPYISVVGFPGTARPGDTLMVPDFSASDNLVPNVGLEADPEVLALGVDFLTDTLTGDWKAVSSRDDFVLVKGFANFVQALTQIRLVTPLGTNVVWPSVGIPLPIGEENTQRQAATVAFGVRTSVLSDARSVAIPDLAFSDLGDGVEVRFSVIPRGDRSPRVIRQVVR